MYELEQFQIEDVQFILSHPRCILGDDTGGGKTVVSADVAKRYLETHPDKLVLIVVECNTVKQWADTFANHCPEIQCTTFTSAIPVEKRRMAASQESGVMIFSFPMVRIFPQFATLCKRAGYVIIDEASILKNYNMATGKILREAITSALTNGDTLIPPEHLNSGRYGRQRLLLVSASPLEKSPADLFSLFGYIHPFILGSYSYFIQRFARYTKVQRIRTAPKKDKAGKPIFGSSRIIEKPTDLQWVNLDVLKTIIDPYLIRHTVDEIKAQTNRSMPDREEATCWLNLNAAQVTEYQRVEHGVGKFTDEELLQPPVVAKHFAQLQICDSTLYDRPVEEIRELPIQDILNSSCKLTAINELLPQMKGRVVIFSQYLVTLELIKRVAQATGRPVFSIQGADSQARRDKSKREFLATDDGILITTRVGEKGVNLPSHYLICYNFIINAQRMHQVRGRICRFNSDIDVCRTLYLVTKGTCEERYFKLIVTERTIFDSIFNGD